MWRSKKKYIAVEKSAISEAKVLAFTCFTNPCYVQKNMCRNVHFFISLFAFASRTVYECALVCLLVSSAPCQAEQSVFETCVSRPQSACTALAPDQGLC